MAVLNPWTLKRFPKSWKSDFFQFTQVPVSFSECLFVEEVEEAEEDFGVAVEDLTVEEEVDLVVEEGEEVASDKIMVLRNTLLVRDAEYGLQTPWALNV